LKNSSKNHYYGSIGRLGRALCETEKAIEIENKMLEMIADKELDDYNRILIFYLYKNYTLPTKKRLLISKRLKDLEEMLNPFGFERIHISHLINMFHLISYQNKGGGNVIMSDESIVPVAQRKKTTYWKY